MITCHEIGRVVCKNYNIDPLLFFGACRIRRVVHPRWIAMLLCVEFTGASLPRIGHVFGDKDHTTVLHGIRRIQRLAAETPAIAEQIEQLRVAIETQPSWSNRVRAEIEAERMAA